LVVGELAGWSRARMPAVLTAFASVLIAGWFASQLTVGMRLIPSLLGPATAVHLAGLIWYTALFFSVVGAMRALAARMPAWVVLELAAMAGAFSVLFASHRGGAIARPLWLSDRAWRMGLDPANVLLGVGGVFAVVLAVLLLLESKRRLSALAVATLPVMASLLVGLVDVKGLQQAPEAADLAEIQSAMGDPPKPTDEDGSAGGDGSETGEEPVPTQGEGDKPKPTDDGSVGTQDSRPEGEGTENGGQPKDASKEGGDGGGEGGEDENSGSAEDGEEQSEDGATGDEQSEEQGGGSGSQSEDAPEGGSGEPSDDADSEGGQPKQPQDSDDADGQDGPAQPVAVVLLGDDYEPLQGAFYLRQEVHSEFVGTRLIKSERPDVDRDVLGHFVSRDETVLDPPPEKHRSLVHGKVAMLVDHTSPFALASPLTYMPMHNPNPRRFVTAYGFESMVLTTDYEQMLGQGVTNQDWSEEVLDHYLEFPIEDPRYIDLAAEIVQPLPAAAYDDPFTRALAVKVWLDTNVKYSLKEKHQGVDDPTADFLFGNKIGYCVHNAHAAVYLWRSLGIPARVGTGYMVDESGRRGSTLIVTNKDAHAWPELYVEDFGWVVMDITPSENLDPPGQPMDEDLADILSDMARIEAIEDAPEPRDYSWLRTALKYTALFTLLALVTTVMFTHWSVKFWRRWRLVFARPKTMPRVGYRVALDLLSEAGFHRFPGETRERFARRLADMTPVFSTLTSLHLSATLGNPDVTAEGRPEFDKRAWRLHLVQLRKELALVPLWRRVLGLFNPFSFYRSR